MPESPNTQKSESVLQRAAGLPSPLAEAAVQRQLSAIHKLQVDDECRSPWLWELGISAGDAKLLRRKHKFRSSPPPPLPEVELHSSELVDSPSTATDDQPSSEEGQEYRAGRLARKAVVSSERVWSWLSSAPGNDEDPELLSPFTEWTTRSPLTPLVFTIAQQPQSLKNAAATVVANAVSPPKQNSSRASSPRLLQQHNNPPASQQSLSSPSTSQVLQGNSVQLTKPSRALPATPVSKVVARDRDIHLTPIEAGVNRLAAMYHDPTKRYGTPVLPERAGVRATPTPSRSDRSHQRSHSRAESHSHRKQPSGSSQSHGRSHSRNNSDSPSKSYQSGSRPSEERGRSRQGKYDFQSDDEDVLSPVQEASARGNCYSRITTVTDFLSQGGEQSPDLPPPMPRQQMSPPKPTLQVQAPKKKEKRRPPPLDLSKTIEYGKTVGRHTNIEIVHNKIPDPPRQNLGVIIDDGSSSVYDDRTPYSNLPTVSPLRIPTRKEMKHPNVLRAYNDFKVATTPTGESIQGGQVERPKSRVQNRNSMYEEPKSAGSVPNAPQPAKVQGIPKSATTNDMKVDTQTAPFTPLTPWITDGRGSRKVSKNLFGDHGWLEDTASQGANKPKPEIQKNTSLFNNIKKKAREFAEFKQSRPRAHSVHRIMISLDAREQSLLYCELDFHLSNALDAYIKTQLNGGRLDPDKLKRVADAWAQKGRPRVIGFRYDLETQVDLVAAHVHDFRFYGSRQVSPAAIGGLLQAMKSNARAMRVRTFCQPDPAVAKHILDAQALLQLLGSPESMQISLAEISQFFKVCVERQKVAREVLEAREAEVEDRVAMHENKSYAQLPRPSQQQQGGYQSRDRGQSYDHDQDQLQGYDHDQTQGYDHDQAQQDARLDDGRQFSGPLLQAVTYDPSKGQQAYAR